MSLILLLNASMVLLLSHCFFPSFSRAKQWLFRIRWRLDFTIRPRESSRRPVCARLQSAVSEEIGGGDAHKNTRSATTAKAALMNIHRVVITLLMQQASRVLSRGYFILKRKRFRRIGWRTSAGVINIHERSLRYSTLVRSRTRRLFSEWKITERKRM